MKYDTILPFNNQLHQHKYYAKLFLKVFLSNFTLFGEVQGVLLDCLDGVPAEQAG